MPFYRQHPNPYTLLARSNVAQPGYVEMSEAAAAAWVAAELAAGWTPAPAPEPEPAPVVLTPLEFFSRLTEPEALAIMTSVDPIVILFRTMGMATSEIRSDDARTLDALGYFEAEGILAAGRSVELLAPIEP